GRGDLHRELHRFSDAGKHGRHPDPIELRVRVGLQQHQPVWPVLCVLAGARRRALTPSLLSRRLPRLRDAVAVEVDTPEPSTGAFTPGSSPARISEPPNATYGAVGRA